MEDRDVGLEAIQVIEVSAQLGVGGNFRLQIRVTELDVGTLPAYGRNTVVQLVDRWRLEASAHTTLEGPLAERVPYQIRPRADLAVKTVIFLVACAQGQVQVLGQAPLIFQEYRPGSTLEVFTGNAIGYFCIPVLATHSHDMGLTQRRNKLTVQNKIVGFQSPVVARHHVVKRCSIGGTQSTGNGTAQGFSLVVGQGAGQGAGVKATGMAQGYLIAVKAQFIAIACDIIRIWLRAARSVTTTLKSVQGAELTVSIVVYLTTPFKIQIQIVVAVGRQRQPGADAVGTSFNRGSTTAVNHAAIFKAKVRLATVINTTTNLHAQQALYQRSAGEKLGGGIISVIPVFLQGLLYGHRAGPLISHFLGDDVDDTTHSVRTIECGHRPTYNLDPLNGR